METKNTQIGNSMKKYRQKAMEYINDKEKAKELWKEASKKTTSEKGRIQSFRDQLLLLIDAFRDWQSGEYRQIPYKTLTMIVIGILYFVVPTDFIPDIFIGAGLVDDAALIAFIVKQIDKDLQIYKDWKITKLTSVGSNNDSANELHKIN